MIASERRCVGVDWRCRESEGKAKIEGYMRVSDEEAHHRTGPLYTTLYLHCGSMTVSIFEKKKI